MSELGKRSAQARLKKMGAEGYKDFLTRISRSRESVKRKLQRTEKGIPKNLPKEA